jgi:hypothetical protein
MFVVAGVLLRFLQHDDLPLRDGCAREETNLVGRSVNLTERFRLTGEGEGYPAVFLLR